MDPAAPPLPPPPPGPPQPPAAPQRRLRRDRSNRILGGVAAGVARTYGIDVMLVRVLFVIAALFGFGIPVYVIAWIAIPPDRSPDAGEERPRDVGMLAGLGLLGIGLLILGDHVLPHGFLFAGHLGFPLFLIAGGIAILVVRSRPPIDEPVAVAESATEVAAPVVEEPASAWTQTAQWPTARETRRQRRRARPRPFLTPITIAALMLAAGIASLLQATGAADVDLTLVLALMTCAVGGVLLLSTWFGRARMLIVIGLVLVVATAVSSALDVPLRGPIGSRTYAPRVANDIQPRYEQAIGNLHLDFDNLVWDGQDRTVHAQLGIGELHVNIPPGARVEIDAHVGAGAVQLFDRSIGGWDVERHAAEPNDDLPGLVPVEQLRGTLHLTLRVGAGHITVNE